MAKNLGDMLSRMGPKGVRTGASVLAAAGAAVWGLSSSLYTGKVINFFFDEIIPKNLYITCFHAIFYLLSVIYLLMSHLVYLS